MLDGRYELLELLGEGGMGQVFKARHHRLGKIFAIKSLRHLSENPQEQAKFLEAFEVEARTLAELDHPALAQVSDFFEVEKIHYLVMEFIDGRTLSRVVDLAPKLLSQRRVFQWATELCQVLHYLHTQNPPVIVRDLKPDNIMIDEKQRLRLLDFGISKRLQSGVGTRDIIKGMGTAEYAPLEQYGSGTTDQRSDIYALGATLYFLLTEFPPPPAWKRASEGIEPRPPSEVNTTVTPEFETLLLSMMALRREDRPQSIDAIKVILEDIGEGGRPSQGPRRVVATSQATSPPVPRSPAAPPVAPGISKVNPEPTNPRVQIPGGGPAYEAPAPRPFTPRNSASASAPQSQRYGLPGEALPHSRTVVKQTPKVSTGKVPMITVGVVRGLRRYATPPQAVSFCPGQALVAVAGRYLQIWNAVSGELVSKLWVGEQELNSVEFSADGRTLVAAETEGAIHQYDLVEQKQTAQLGRRNWGLFQDKVRGVCLLFGQTRMAVASDSSNIRVFNTRNGEVVALIDWHQTGFFSKLSRKTLCLASSRQGLLASGGADGSLSLFDTGKFELKERKTLGFGEILSLEFSPDGRFLAVAASRGKVLLLKTPSLELVHELRHPATPHAVSFSHDMRVVATGASDCQIRLFHLNTGKELCKLSHHSGAVLSVDFCDQGPLLVSAGNDRRLFAVELNW